MASEKPITLLYLRQQRDGVDNDVTLEIVIKGRITRSEADSLRDHLKKVTTKTETEDQIRTHASTWLESNGFEVVTVYWEAVEWF